MSYTDHCSCDLDKTLSQRAATHPSARTAQTYLIEIECGQRAKATPLAALFGHREPHYARHPPRDVRSSSSTCTANDLIERVIRR